MNALLLAIALSASTTAVAAPVKNPAKQMVCGAPQALATDSAQTVRYCEFK